MHNCLYQYNLYSYPHATDISIGQGSSRAECSLLMTSGLHLSTMIADSVATLKYICWCLLWGVQLAWWVALLWSGEGPIFMAEPHSILFMAFWLASRLCSVYASFIGYSSMYHAARWQHHSSLCSNGYWLLAAAAKSAAWHSPILAPIEQVWNILAFHV